jgi:hypothetical protein
MRLSGSWKVAGWLRRYLAPAQGWLTDDMLDLNQLIQQIDKIGLESFAEPEDQQEKFLAAENAMSFIESDPTKFLEKVDLSQGKVLWPVAIPLEDIKSSLVVPPHLTPVTVIGVDGSQIMPSHHEVHTCYLLNVGCVEITYGSPIKPRLTTRPHLFHRPEDLYPLVDRRRVQVDELYISLERTILELQTLAQLSMENLEKGLPVVAFMDGSLIPWSVEKLTDKYKKFFLERMSAAMNLFNNAGIPIVGYLSSSRATDVVNMLRVAVCPFEVSDCRKNCAHLNEENFPCSTVWPLADRQLFFNHLVPKSRSSVFLSGSDVMRKWIPDERICFTYLHVGAEIARVEFPRWLFQKPELLEQTLGVIVSQAAKGMGYPVCLSEAHHLAVIRGSEREKFFELMAARMVNLGLPKIRTSPKESGKKVGFI